ncbi:MAG: phosphoesterase [Cyanobacteria bacterium J06642_3]
MTKKEYRLRKIIQAKFAEAPLNQDFYGDLPKMTDLNIEFEQINLPTTLEMGDIGSVEVTITNEGSQIASGLTDINLYTSSDREINQRLLADTGQLVNDGLLTTEEVDITGLKPGESQTVTFEYANNTSYVSPAAYTLIAEAVPEKDTDPNLVNNQTFELVSAPGTDVVLDWNAIAINAAANHFRYDSVPEVGAAPPQTTRTAAMLHAAIYDAVNGIEGTYTPYAIDIEAPEGASTEAAVVGAGYTVLSELFPEQTEMFDLQKDKSLAEIADGVSEDVGYVYGQAVAKALLASRANELDVEDPDNYPYNPPEGENVWRPGEDGIAVGAGYGNDAITWGIPSSDEFLPDGPSELGSEEYAQQLEEVRVLGGKEDTALTTIIRTEEQSEIAEFWLNDRGDSYKPGKHWNHIAQEIAVNEGNSLVENARLFLHLNTAVADAVIVAWDAKYTYLDPRPVTDITGLYGVDGNPVTTIDPEWESFVETPPFPDYISGHATIGGAAASVLSDFYGEEFEFTAVSPDLPGVVRSYESFDEAALENANSRLYGGVHPFEAGAGEALPTGDAIGDFVVANIAQSII